MHDALIVGLPAVAALVALFVMGCELEHFIPNPNLSFWHYFDRRLDVFPMWYLSRRMTHGVGYIRHLHDLWVQHHFSTRG